MEDQNLPPQKLHPLIDVVPPDEPEEPFYKNYKEGVPIAIDMGLSTVRAGLTNSAEPNNVFPSVVSRYRHRKSTTTLTIVGNDCLRSPAVRSSTKPPYDGPLVTNWDYIEFIMDYTIEHLGVTSNNGRLNNPVIMTEPIACPFNQRKNMYELLFEAYRAPAVTFGIDSLFSYYANTNGKSNGLVIGTGHEQSHIIPVLDGKGILLQTKRIDFGGNTGQQFLSRILALKYPYFPTKLNSNHTTNLFKDHCYVLTDYQQELSHYLDMDFLDNHDIVIQAPVDVSNVSDKKKSDEELARQTQRRREQGKRLQEQAQQKRAEKLVQKQQEYDYYVELQKEIVSLDENLVETKLEEHGFDDLSDFKKYFNTLEKSLKRANQGNFEEEESVEPSTTWPLVDIPDDQLTADQIKEKRKQKLNKGNYEARERNRELKRQEEEEKIRRQKEEEEWRKRDLEGWCNQKRLEVAEIISKMKERAKLIDSFKDRKSMAAQQRMKNIADLANDENGSTNSASRKRRRNVSSTIDNDPNDTFGANDDDWSVYRDISNKTLEEDQEADNEEVVKLEEELLKYDPNFHQEDTLAASQVFDWRNLVLHKFLHGPRPNITIAMQAEGMDPEEIANHPDIITKNRQIHLNIERIRVPEILFQPIIAGLDQAGIPEILEDLIHRRLDGILKEGGQSYSIVQDVFLTGGLARLKNIRQRVETEFTSFLPVGTPLKVRTARDPLLDTWKGMQKWSTSDECKKSYVSIKEYEEYGPEYIKEHGLGNVCLR